MPYCLDTDTVLSAFRILSETEIKSPSAIFAFLVVKACGFSKTRLTSWESVSENGLYPAYRLGGLFSPNEESPEKYDFVYPFSLDGWSKQPTQPLKEYVGGRIRNNLSGGATTSRAWVDHDQTTNSGKFKFDYVNQVKEIAMGSSTLNLLALGVWINRFNRFERKPRRYDLISDFKKSFKLTREEIAAFMDTKPLPSDLRFSSVLHNSEEIRKHVGDPNDMADWHKTRPKTTTTDDYKLSKKVTIERSYMKVTPSYLSRLLRVYRQVILYGPSGTSKSYLASSVAKKFDAYTNIQFHPGYSYQDFIGGYYVEGRDVKYKKGVLLNVLESIKRGGDNKFLLIIDEINRANLSLVLGEAIQLLDRDFKVDITINGRRETLSLPDNLFVLGTMNSSDRTVGSIDHALRRRFMFVRCSPDPDLLAERCDTEMNISLGDLLLKLNFRLMKVLKDRELAIGHSIFLDGNYLTKSGKYHWTNDGMEEVFNHKIVPTIEEFCYGDDNKIKEVIGSDLSGSLTGEDFVKALSEYLSS